MTRYRALACCAVVFSLAGSASADEARCTQEQIAKMKTILTAEEIGKICGAVGVGTPLVARMAHAGEPVPRVNWGALEDYFDISSLRLGGGDYRPELQIEHNALEFDVRATSKIWPLGRMWLPYWRACFYDRENIHLEVQKMQFEPLYGSVGWTAGMRGKGYIHLPEKLNLADVGVIRVKRLPCN